MANWNEERWSRLASQLTEATGVAVKVSERAYPGGVSRSIIIVIPGSDALIEVHDKWWRKNPDKWIGYAVHVEGQKDGLVRREWQLTTKRSEVVAAVSVQFTAGTGDD